MNLQCMNKVDQLQKKIVRHYHKQLIYFYTKNSLVVVIVVFMLVSGPHPGPTIQL